MRPMMSRVARAHHETFGVMYPGLKQLLTFGNPETDAHNGERQGEQKRCPQARRAGVSLSCFSRFECHGKGGGEIAPPRTPRFLGAAIELPSEFLTAFKSSFAGRSDRECVDLVEVTGLRNPQLGHAFVGAKLAHRFLCGEGHLGIEHDEALAADGVRGRSSQPAPSP